MLAALVSKNGVQRRLPPFCFLAGEVCVKARRPVSKGQLTSASGRSQTLPRFFVAYHLRTCLIEGIWFAPLITSAGAKWCVTKLRYNAVQALLNEGYE